MMNQCLQRISRYILQKRPGCRGPYIIRRWSAWAARTHQYPDLLLHLRTGWRFNAYNFAKVLLLETRAYPQSATWSKPYAVRFALCPVEHPSRLLNASGFLPANFSRSLRGVPIRLCPCSSRVCCPPAVHSCRIVPKTPAAPFKRGQCGLLVSIWRAGLNSVIGLNIWITTRTTLKVSFTWSTSLNFIFYPALV